ncbi:cellulose biosynthesis protein BcsO [Pantoea sp.]|uniref:cellulose biosynthesis protein BcsO n=1 Tax=Pantoea sp. TaxID=69393 RepID=UPI002897389F|nr:cellulose biosynthesis protein BcsO [Pantoea sp.]
MNNYDDLQRFKEKTQTIDIAFKDMSGQAQETSRSQWALIRQLETGHPEAPLSGEERNVPAPVPMRAGELSASTQAPEPHPFARTQTAAQPRASLLDSLAANLKPVEPEAPPANLLTAASPFAATAEAHPLAAKTTVRQEAAAEPARFGALFRTRSSEPVSLPKATLLKPLLEKIALCR